MDTVMIVGNESTCFSIPFKQVEFEVRFNFSKTVKRKHPSEQVYFLIKYVGSGVLASCRNAGHIKDD